MPTGQTGGGEPIGTLQVDITANLSPLETALQNAERLLDNFNAKVDQAVQKSKSIKGGRGRGGQAAADQPSAGAAQGTPSQGTAKVNADLHIDGEDVVSEIQTALDHVKLRVNLDMEHLQEQLGGMRLGTAGGSAAGGVSPQVAANLARQEVAAKRAFTQALTQRGLNIPGLRETVNSLTSALQTARGQTPSDDPDFMHGIASLLDEFGDNLDDWVETVKVGRNDVRTGNLAGRVGATGGEAAAINQLVGMLVGDKPKLGGSFLLDFMDELRGAAPTPAPTFAPGGSSAQQMGWIRAFANVTAKAEREAAGAPVEKAAQGRTEDDRRKTTATLQDRTFIGRPFSTDLLAGFLGKYFTPELRPRDTRNLPPGERRPDFSPFFGIAEMLPKESGTGRIPKSGENLIGFDRESASPIVERLRKGKDVGFEQGRVRGLSIEQVLRKGFQRLRGSEITTEEEEARFQDILQQARDAEARQIQLAKPSGEAGKQTGFVSFGGRLEESARLDVRLAEVNRLIDRLRSGRFGASRQRRVASLSAERERLIEEGAQPLDISPAELGILREARRASSQTSRAAVAIGLGKTPGEIKREERAEARAEAAIKDARPFVNAIERFGQMLTSGQIKVEGEEGEAISTRQFVGRFVAGIRNEARAFFSGITLPQEASAEEVNEMLRGTKLPPGVGAEITAAAKALQQTITPRLGGEARPRGGTNPREFTQGQSVGEQDVRQGERPGATPTGIARVPIATARSLRIAELESLVGESASETTRGESSAAKGIDAQTQLFVRRDRANREARAAERKIREQLAIEAAKRANIPINESFQGGFTEATEANLKAIQSTDPTVEGAQGRKITRARKIFAQKVADSTELAAAVTRREAAEADIASAQDELGQLRKVRESARKFIDVNQGLGLAGILEKAAGSRGAVRNVSRAVEDEIQQMLRTPGPGDRESGEVNSVLRALGRDFIGERNQGLSGDETRRRFGRTSLTPGGEEPGEAGPSALDEAARLAGIGAGGGVARGESAESGRPFERLIERFAGGGAGGGPGAPGGAPPGGGGGFGEVTGPIHVIVDNVPLRVTFEGTAGAAAAGDFEGAAAQSRIEHRINRANARRSIKESESGGFVDKTIEQLRAGGKSDEQIRNFLKAQGFGGAAELALPRESSSVERFRPGLLNAELDAIQEQSAPRRAELRAIERRVPKRGFTASITDLITASLGGEGFERQLAALDRARQESAELDRLERQQAVERAKETGIGEQLATPGLRAGQRRTLEKDLEGVRKRLAELDPAIASTKKNFADAAKEAGGAGRVFKSFAAAGAGAAVSAGIGSVTFGLGLAITGPLIAAVSEGLLSVIGPAFEKFTGNAGKLATAQSAVADQIRAAAGQRDVVAAQVQAQTGLPTGTEIAGTIADRAEIVAGNRALQEQIDLFKAAQRIRREGGAEIAATQTTGGVIGPIGGVAPASEILANLINEFGAVGPRPPETIPTPIITRGVRGIATGPGLPQGPEVRNPAFDEWVTRTAEQADLLTFLNAQLEKAGEGANEFVAATEVHPIFRGLQAAAFQAAGAPQLAGTVNRVVIVDESGNPILDPTKLAKIATDIPKFAARPELEPLVEALEPTFRAQTELRLRQLNLQRETVLPAQRGFEEAAAPLLPATAGFAPEDAARFAAPLGEIQDQFNEIAADAARARQEAKDFVAETFIGDAAHLAGEFASHLDRAVGYGQQIADIQLGIQTQQAAFQAAQYSNQLRIANRSLQDALGLTGKITNATDNLGAIERKQFFLQRESQALSIAQSQRQINFQQALAGLVAPGETGEERAARIEQAKIEADFAQKQLNIQKELFGLGGAAFRITADRNVEDILAQISLLQQGRELQLNTQVAEKRIIALTKLMDRELKNAQAIFEAAVAATQDIFQLEAQLVAQTGRNLAEVANAVISAVARTYREVSKIVFNDTSGGGGNTNQGSLPQARGNLFNTTGATDITVGEAGTETVAILRNPRSVTGSFDGGSPTQIYIDLRGATFTSEDERRKVINEISAAVERSLGRKGNMLGLSRPA